MGVQRRIESRCGRAAADIAAVLDRLEALLREEGCPPPTSAPFLVVAEEMVTNVARYAWPGDATPGVFTVSAGIRRQAGGIEVLLATEDDGVPFDPTLRAAPDTDGALEDRPVGGLGLHLVMRMTDWQCYRREAGRNRFSVIWRCPPQP